MAKKQTRQMDYAGFEQGPIRPPSEAGSLLIRVTRNCPWNHCLFCPVYKRDRFSVRPVAHVLQDIDRVHGYVQALQQAADEDGRIDRPALEKISGEDGPQDLQALQAALHWYAGGMGSIFLQDANSLIIRPGDLVTILLHLKKRFPGARRITSYARSHTIARIADRDLAAIASAGLNRIHIGLESGSDAVLKLVKKGATKAVHIKAGIKVKQAGMELSEYVMPGLGGRSLSAAHALETADALNRINPDFIRLRTLAIPFGVPLYRLYAEGRFEKCTDLMMAKEILLFLETLEGITSRVKSDHVLNLFQEIEGRLPDDKAQMTRVIRVFLAMPPEKQAIYQIGRRTGIFAALADMEEPYRLARAEAACRELGVTPANTDAVIDRLMGRFI